MDMISIIQQMLILFLLILIGYMTAKKGVLGDNSNRVLTKLVLYITSPALIMNSVINGEIQGSKLDTLFIIFLSLMFFLLMPIVAKILSYIVWFSRKKHGMYEAMYTFSNLGFMGIPVINAIYGSEAVFYVSIFMIPFNILVNTYGLLLLSENKQAKFDYKKILNPCAVAAVLALIFYLLSIPTTKVIDESIAMLGSVTTPVAMIIIGATLSTIPIKEVFLDYRLYIFAAIKLLVLPYITYYVFRPFVTNETLLGVMVIIAGMPVATNVALLCTEFGGDTESVAKGIFISTIMSLVTIPILAMTIL